MKADRCEAAVFHRPRPVQIDRHHILPRSDGGPTVPGNLANVCPDCHTSIHLLLSSYRQVGGKPPWSVRRRFPRGVQKLAARGWAAIIANPRSP